MTAAWYVMGREWGGWRIISDRFETLTQAFNSPVALGCRRAHQEHMYQNWLTGTKINTTDGGFIVELGEAERSCWQKDGF